MFSLRNCCSRPTLEQEIIVKFDQLEGLQVLETFPQASCLEADTDGFLLGEFALQELSLAQKDSILENIVDIKPRVLDIENKERKSIQSLSPSFTSFILDFSSKDKKDVYEFEIGKVKHDLTNALLSMFEQRKKEKEFCNSAIELLKQNSNFSSTPQIEQEFYAIHIQFAYGNSFEEDEAVIEKDRIIGFNGYGFENSEKLCLLVEYIVDNMYHLEKASHCEKPKASSLRAKTIRIKGIQLFCSYVDFKSAAEIKKERWFVFNAL